ncbi:regulatory protein GemA [Thalassococcus sp. CAU 1522]|uniref:Regulatory protein GemA n=1 Tax=Thalassococcus arenae TaxID=2851652 RepID=A0ABS6NBR1_9RHOB|nr:regulatory protein GemA [Thalassococcus arenae]MBV2360990.1 regulatory protein GemA [Thalassococcus arenae]
MSISDNQRKLFWVAARKLGWTEDQLRPALAQIAGVTSVNDLDRDGFDAMMGFFEYCGFTPLSAKGKDYGDRPGMASFAQIELIRALWSEYTRRQAGEDELKKWLANKWHVSSLRFVTAEMAGKMIAALKAMKARAA